MIYEVAFPQSGSSSTLFLVELEFGNVGFWGEGKTGVPGKKPSRSKEENQQQTQPTYGVDAEIWTRATWVGGECSHHCAIPCSFLVIAWLCKGYTRALRKRHNIL